MNPPTTSRVIEEIPNARPRAIPSFANPAPVSTSGYRWIFRSASRPIPTARTATVRNQRSVKQKTEPTPRIMLKIEAGLIAR